MLKIVQFYAKMLQNRWMQQILQSLNKMFALFSANCSNFASLLKKK